MIAKDTRHSVYKSASVKYLGPFPPLAPVILSLAPMDSESEAGMTLQSRIYHNVSL